MLESTGLNNNTNVTHGNLNALHRGEGNKLGLMQKLAKGAESGNEATDFHSSARKLLNDQIMQALKGSSLVHPNVPLKELDPDAFTPEAVAQRILNFIGEAVGTRRDAQGDEAAEEMLSQAKAGVEQGFDEAKDILKNLGIFQGRIQEDAEQTYDLIQNGLADFTSRLGQGLPLFNIDSGHSVEFAHSSERYAEQKNLSLQVKTRDGDVVTINIDRAQDFSQAQSSLSTGQGQAFYSEQNYSESHGVSFTVNGDLDEAEMAAITSLVDDIRGVSDTFFNGDSQAALNHALDIGYDSNEIAGFSFKLSHSQTSAATQAYAAIDGLDSGRNADFSLPQLDKLLSPLADMMRDVEHLLGRAAELFDAGEARQDTKGLFDALSLMDARKLPAIDHLENHSKQPFEQLTNALFAPFLGDK